MKNNQSKGINLNAAVAFIRKEVNTIGEQLRTAEGAEKEALQKRMADLMSSLGMSYDPESPIVDFFAEVDSTAGATGAQANGGAAASEELPPADDKATDTQTGWFARFKSFIGRNKKSIAAGAAAAVAAGAGLYYFLRGNGEAAPEGGLFHGMSAETAAQAAEATAENPTVMARIGAYLVAGVEYVKKGALVAKDWVVGLFSSKSAEAAVVVANAAA